MGPHIFKEFQIHQPLMITEHEGTSKRFLRWFSPTITKQTTAAIILLMLILCLRVNFSKAATKFDKGHAIIDIFSSEEELSISLARQIAHSSETSIGKRGIFTIVLSGDSLVTSMRKLLEEPYVNSINWSNWYIFWVDERVVSKTSPLSNYRLDFDQFLSKVPIPSEQIISINDKHSSPEEAAADYEARLRQLVARKVIAISHDTGFPRFDLMLLGLGYNGHIASLFPDRPQLKENTRWVTFIEDSPKPPPSRITMTFPVINSSSKVAFVVTGADKAQIVKRVLDGSGSGRGEEVLPAQMVLPADGELEWFLDNDAALLMLQN